MQTIDSTGNSKSNFATLGATNHSELERADRDFYATSPDALEALLRVFDLPKDKFVWECAAGNGHLAEVLSNFGYNVFASDIVERDYPLNKQDFLKCEGPIHANILTNPPYAKALEFVKHALTIIRTGNYVIMFMRIQFLEGQKRYKELFNANSGLKYVYVFSERAKCARNGLAEEFGKASAVAYAWYVWQKGYHDEPVIRWIPPRLA
jgi:hypothetical protein